MKLPTAELWGITNTTKGGRFEHFVFSEMFNDKLFDLIEMTGDFDSNSKRYLSTIISKSFERTTNMEKTGFIKS